MITRPEVLDDPPSPDDLLIAVALCEFSVHNEDAEPALANRAWTIAAEICEMHGLEPGEVLISPGG